MNHAEPAPPLLQLNRNPIDLPRETIRAAVTGTNRRAKIASYIQRLRIRAAVDIGECGLALVRSVHRELRTPRFRRSAHRRTLHSLGRDREHDMCLAGPERSLRDQPSAAISKS